MIQNIYTLPKRFNIYQKERFPIFPLVISLFPAILSSGAVLNNISISNSILTLIATILYLLHIRIIDDHRDFEHDNIHHIERPVQKGVISKKELISIDITAIIIFLIISALINIYAFYIAIVMYFYSYLASQDFFIKKYIRKYFFVYNIINLLQMILMQIFVYYTFTDKLNFNLLILIHFLFTSIGSITFEFIRKLKIPGNDGTGEDTYTWHLGFAKSLILYAFFCFFNIVSFTILINLIINKTLLYFIFSGIIYTILMIIVFIHKYKKSYTTDLILRLSFLLSYATLNLIIYYIKF